MPSFYENSHIHAGFDFQSRGRTGQKAGDIPSALYTRAAEDFIRAHTNDGVTEVLNKLYGEDTSSLDPVLQGIHRVSLKEEDW